MYSFSEIGLRGEILDAISELGFTEPTPIQEKTIPHLLTEQSDFIGLAQTGTGKTAAFGLPIIQQVEIADSSIQSLVLCPTRELCLQITNEFKNYSKYYGKIGVVPVYGGASVTDQIQALRNRAHIVVGTPGRVLDLLKRKKLDFSKIKTLVLDEADEMLSMGFKDDMDAILATTSPEKRVLLFSATMPKAIAEIAKKYMHQPKEVAVNKKNVAAENVEHQRYLIQSRNRFQALKRIVDINPQIYSIVFCRTRRETKEVADKLMQEGYNADALHGDLSQAQRDTIMRKFRLNHLNILIATDVAARGLDVENLTHIINYNLPDDPEVYIHRTGRTGRAGRKGIAVTFYHSREKGKMNDIERKLGKPIERKMIPSGKEICEKQLFNRINSIEKHTEFENPQIEPYLPEIYKKLSWISKEDLIKRFVTLEFTRLLDSYKDAPDINISEKEASNNRGTGSKERGQKSFTRFFLNIGSDQKVSKNDLIGLVNRMIKKTKIEIGKIEVLNAFSFIEIDSAQEKLFQDAFQGKSFNGKKINVEIAKNQEKPSRRRSKKRKRV
ncbi:MAG: DEAD/DEAH box helicase [Bacteroidales bacterium]